jgi:4,5-DOPA dioxygenase extradiol
VQLGIDETQSAPFHYELAKRLAPLRDEGVLIVGSGNVVHNLRRIDWSDPDGGFEWTRRFDDDVAAIVTSDPSRLPSVQEHDDFAMAVPTPDHFIPLLHIAGVAAASSSPAHVLVDGYAMGSLSMAAYTVGCDTVEPGGGGGSPPLPRIPADETNI